MDSTAHGADKDGGRAVTGRLLLIALAGAGAGVGLLLVVGAATGVLGRDPDRPAFGAVLGESRIGGVLVRLRGPRRSTVLRAAAGGVAGVAAWLITGWPAAALLVTGLAVGVPWLFGAGRLAGERLDRAEALASWCRRLRDIVATGHTTLTHALRDPGTAPVAIAGAVDDLAQRLRTEDVDSALRAFADDVDDYVGDQIVAALLIAYQQGAGVARILTRLADAVDHEVAARREIEAHRAGPRKTARILVGIYLGLLAALSLNGSYLAPYDTPLGQLVLVAFTGIVFAALVWLRNLSLTPTVPRFLTAPHPTGPTPRTSPRPTAGARR